MLKSAAWVRISQGAQELRALPASRELLSHLKGLIPGAELGLYRSPEGALRAALIEEGSGRAPLPADRVAAVMDAPPFWSLLWPSGELLCRLLTTSPRLVQGRSFLDFGAGSGVLASAAALAGAEATAYDTDPHSRLCCLLQAQLNAVTVKVESTWEPGRHQLIAFCDMFYDEEQLPLLDRALEGGSEILVADTRLSTPPHQRAQVLGEVCGSAVPDLDPHREFGTVRLWYCGSRFEQWRAALEQL